MKKLKTAALLASLCMISTLATVPQSSAAIMDFDSATPGTFLTADYLEDGFRMVRLFGHYDLLANGGAGNTIYLNIDTSVTGPVSTVRFDFFGGLFDLLALDVIAAGGTLTTSAGGIVNPTSTGPQNFSGPAFTNLTFVDFSTTGELFPGIDSLNLVPSSPSGTVSEPLTVSVVGLGLAALLWSRRRADDKKVRIP